MQTVVAGDPAPVRKDVSNNQRYVKARRILLLMSQLPKGEPGNVRAAELLREILEIFPWAEVGEEARKIHRTLNEFGYYRGTVLHGSLDCPLAIHRRPR